MRKDIQKIINYVQENDDLEIYVTNNHEMCSVLLSSLTFLKAKKIKDIERIGKNSYPVSFLGIERDRMQDYILTDFRNLFDDETLKQEYAELDEIDEMTKIVTDYAEETKGQKYFNEASK